MAGKAELRSGGTANNGRRRQDDWGKGNGRKGPSTATRTAFQRPGILSLIEMHDRAAHGSATLRGADIYADSASVVAV